ncbi:MAG TPA: VWA domain-containing protein [Armatimonadetes bacterium]|nr:VWA domain-containing protein [Armatimonadota bacterium]
MPAKHPKADVLPVTEGTLIINEAEASALPLEHTEVEAQVTGPVASVRVTQTFGNPFEESIEVTYLFPLPHEAAVTAFEMRIGDRVIRGRVQEREEAQRIYEKARAEGRRAGLLEQERPNLFTVSVANLAPGHKIEVSLAYQEHLPFDDGEYRFVFPLVVTPRYIPREGVPDAQRVVAPLQPPEERPGGDIGLTLRLDAGVPIEEPRCLSHEIQTRRIDDQRVEVRLAKKGVIPNKDFVLTYRPAGETIRPVLWLYRESEDSGTFLLSVLPPRDLTPEETRPREMIFVLDRSGSMGGTPIVQARYALKACLRCLNPEDTFHLIIFDHEVKTFTREPVPFTQENVDRADAFIDGVEARGGTEILEALKAALGVKPDPERLRTLVFLTDGSVGNEEQVLRYLTRNLGGARVFTFGIGPAVNRYLLSKLAKLGRGAAEFLLPEQDLEEAMTRFQNRVAFPVLTDIELSWSYGVARDVYPQPVPDLFLGQPVEIVGRFHGGGRTTLRLKGQTASGPHTGELTVDFTRATREHEALPRLWARARIDHLLERERENPQEKAALRDEIIGLALTYSLMSPYTSFVAVDEVKEGEAKGAPKPVPVSLPLPEGLDYDLLVYGPSPPPVLALFWAAEPQKVVHEAEILCCRVAAFAETQPSAVPLEAREESLEVEAEGESELKDRPGAALRWLVRAQNVSGSWGRGEGEVATTAAAVLAFARQGHTHRRGSFRPLLARALRWLRRQTPTEPTAAALVAWALAEVARQTGREEDAEAARRVLDALPSGEPSGLADAAWRAALSAARQAGIGVVPVASTPSPALLPRELHNLGDLQTLVLAALAGQSEAAHQCLAAYQLGAQDPEVGAVRVGSLPLVTATAWGALVLSL